MSISDIAGVSEPKEPSPEASSTWKEDAVPPSTFVTTVTEDTAPDSNTKEAPAPEPEPAAEVPTAAESTNAFLDLMMDKMVSVADIKRPPIKMMIFADPGVGKTLFTGQIENNLIIDTEQGTLTLAANKDSVPDSVRILPYKSFEGLDKTVDTLISRPDALKDIEVLTIDSLTTLHKKGLAEVTTREHKKSPNLVNQFVPETEHHSENNERIRRLVEKIKNFDGSVIFTTHVRTLERKGHNTKIFPDFSEKLANTLSGMLDVVAYYYIAKIDDEFKRVMMFQPSTEVYAKNRLNLPRNIIDPTWDKIYDALEF